MPRSRRVALGGICYHVLNRGNCRNTVFLEPCDYAGFVRLIGRANRRFRMRMLAYCLMPNHFHLVLWPRGDRDLGRWLHWLLTTQVRQHHARHGTDGRIWQGRTKQFPIQQNQHLLNVMRYVERNPLRAGLVTRAEAWKWSSLGVISEPGRVPGLTSGPVPKYLNWQGFVNAPITAAELAAMRNSVGRQAPYGEEGWALEASSIHGNWYPLGGAAGGRPRSA
ncbi:MAG: transposase [Acidobacteria bacterium]|uniref:Transposase n=1 Tax=Candidatus Polarisedimenticola svalbardensis TaxID=2886004 RepID=A0A8J7C295_9BACT|nr:transposase [Candidatus Polarisedimenticola svalbardensis]